MKERGAGVSIEHGCHPNAMHPAAGRRLLLPVLVPPHTLSLPFSMILQATACPVSSCSALRTLQKPPLPSTGPST